jgi:hypothetical protein
MALLTVPQQGQQHTREWVGALRSGKLENTFLD